jgi:hypothetical protein
MVSGTVQGRFVQCGNCGTVYRVPMFMVRSWSGKTWLLKVCLDNAEMICYKKHKLEGRSPL